jgi:hypothetical protein
MRNTLKTLTLLSIAGLSAIGLAIAPSARAVSPAPARPAAAGLHVTAKITLGRLGASFSYVLTEAPNGNVYYSRGAVVYVVKGSHAPVAVLHAPGPVLAVTANSSDLLVDVGNKVSAYALSNGHLLRSWTLPSPAKVTSAGLYAVGSTVWAYTDWATDMSGFQFANVDRLSLSSSVVHRVTANDAYPGDMAADSAGLYYQATVKGLNGALVRALPSGAVHSRFDLNVGAPLALAGGNVYLVAIHDNQGGNEFLDAFHGSTLSPVFSRRVANANFGVAGTGIGLLMLGTGKVSLLNAGTGAARSVLSVPGAVALVPGPSAAVVTVIHGTTFLLRLAG